MPAVKELEKEFSKIKKNKKFNKEYSELLSGFVGRPTALYYAKHLSKKLGCKVYLKRELTRGKREI